MKRELNPAHVERLKELVNNSPLIKLLDMQLTDLGPGRATVELHASEQHWNPFASVHGGVYAALIDTAAYWAAYAYQEEDAGYTSLDLNVTNLRMALSGTLTAEARAIKEGRSICLTDVLVTDEQGKLVAHGTSKLIILEDKQSLSNAVPAMGHAPLPPKFLAE